MSKLRVEAFPWLAAPLGGENPQAMFRDRSPDVPVVARDSLPAKTAATIGHGCGRRILPYRMQDRYGRERRMRDFRSVVLENEHLSATFLPELGGRMISLVRKEDGRELLFRNPVFQPANLALRDAWFAGGIEWNVGQYGHAFHTSSPVFATAIRGLGNSLALRLYDYDRCKGLLWQIDFHLPPGARFLYAFTRVVNPRPETIAMYWWTNVAVPEAPDVRVLAPASQSVYVDYTSTSGLAYGQADLPALPTIGGRDGTYSKNLSFTNEFFFQCQEADMPWEAALDGKGTGFIEASTHPLNVRKLFCWGMHDGGRRWKEFLSEPGRGDYIEIQGGLAPTQQHTVPMPGRSQWCWTQAFGSIAADPARVHGSDWGAAWRAVDEALKRQLPLKDLEAIHAQCAPLAELPPTEILHAGGGWGALEARRRAAQGEEPLPAALSFPASTLGPEQQRWIALLETGHLPDQDPALPPGEWMIQSEWRTLLERSQRSDWFTLLHLGVMKIESFDDAGAESAWQESLRLRPSAWAHRNLGALALRQGAPAKALQHYKAAWELASGAGVPSPRPSGAAVSGAGVPSPRPDVSFALEYLAALHDAGEMESAWTFYHALPSDMKALGTVRLLAAKVALARNDLPFVEESFDADFASIREGARDLTELWYECQARLAAARTGLALDEALRAEVRRTCPPPFRIDFRVIE